MINATQFVGKNKKTAAEVSTTGKAYFEDGLGYLVEIAAVTAKVTKNGWNVLDIKLGKVKSNGEVMKPWSISLFLPVYSEALEASTDPEKLASSRTSAARNLLNLFRGIDPKGFGTGLSRKDLNSAIQAIAESMVDQEFDFESLVGSRLHLVQVAAANSDNKYHNFYAELPSDIELATV